ncbi:diguanylate cyclase [Paenibacillus jamilae]|uniref:Diguanylate cyclase n=1 Tax=Paenibacillus jamilae TaxID=114136 RepID=A0ACC4ZWD0_9BACL|nr:MULTISPECIES: diguanylate cyclase [Paenibacillus]AUO06713.1 GGDEF domain-containing protein [Paenibacillus sp. lzh-N1]KTS82744.1 diguanylate cyclase [Paenibacillus jamilae]
MLKELINNFALLTSFLFFGNLLLRKYERYLEKHRYIHRVINGLMLGLFGILLMMAGLWIPGDFVVDLRQLAIIVSVYMGGSVSGLLTTLIIILYRIYITGSWTEVSLIATVNGIMTLAVSLTFIREKILKLSKWMSAVLGSTVVSLLATFYVASHPHYGSIIIFTTIKTLGGLFAYFMMHHIKKTERAIHLLEEAANRDHLTGLYSPRAFDALFEEVIHTSKTTKKPFGLVMLDIDHFKEINDTYGHLNGDTVLSQLGILLNRESTTRAYPSRKGGEEFAILLGDCDIEKAAGFAEKIRKAVENECFLLNDGTIISLTVSIGAGSSPVIASRFLLEKADEALYEAKRSGRNRVELAKP